MLELKLNRIKDKNPGLYGKLKNYIIPENINLQVFNSESGDANLLYNNTELHCKKNPQIEALQEFKRIKPDFSTVVVIMGLGLGYAAKRFFKDSKCKIVVFEPDLNILKFTLDNVDFSENLKSDRFFIATSVKEIIQVLDSAFSYKNKVVISKLASSEKLYPELTSKLTDELNKIVPALNSNYATLFKNSRFWVFSGLYKLKGEKKDTALVALEGKFKNKTALIVSAGPSLDKNIEIIKQNRDKFILFCVNVAYKRLISEGIVPDFTVHLDITEVQTIKNYDHSKTNIIAHSSAYAKIFEELGANKFFTYYCKNDLLSRWLSEFCWFSIENYVTKGSVAHLAMSAAYNMGCSPIILTGQDLAFTDGKFYSSGSFWGDLCNIDDQGKAFESGAINDKSKVKNKLEQFEKTRFIRVLGQNNEPVLTSIDYAGFISHFEDFSNKHGSEISLINCSTGGANLEGFENKNLEEIVSFLEPVNLNINEYLEKIISSNKDPVLDNLDRIRNELNKLNINKNKFLQITDRGIKGCESLLMEMRSRKINPAKVKALYTEIIESFNRLDDNLFNKYDFTVGFAFQELTEFNMLMRDDSAPTDASTFINFAKQAKSLFYKTGDSIRRLNKNILPL